MGTTDDDEGWPEPREGRCNGRRHHRDGSRSLCTRQAGWRTPYHVGPCAQHGGTRGDKPEPVARPVPVDDGWPPPVDGRCNAKKDNPKRRCGNPAGHGTDYDVGSCARHGGLHQNGRKRAARMTYEAEYARSPLFGQLVELPPTLGLTLVAAELHGFAAYVKERIAETADERGHVQLVETSGDKAAVDVKVRLWMDALDRAARVYKMGADADVDQQQIDLVASYQERVLDIVEAVLRDVGVDPDDPAVAEKVGTRFALLSGGVGRVS